ncbi:hypothetical protein [Marinoscillum sp. 108]|uniref:hypothetical protein n=1 Tax=Marinoscillum sp. 108 TaxID=2653151 RepID=UPI0012F0FC1B|nr:hypothetical protein [Marinoscillum sp. 108]VXD10889.1 conserved exported hypothetical protein [Marinoscillum sp. 108]
MEKILFLIIAIMITYASQAQHDETINGTTFKTNGNVGIGTSNPSGQWGEKLHVFSSNSNNGIKIERGDGASGSFLAYQNAVYLGSGSSHNLGFLIGGTTKVLLNTNGILGIGTTTPSTQWGEKLHVHSNNSNTGIKIGRGDGAWGSFLAYEDGVYLGSGSVHKLGFLIGGQTKLLINQTGDVGIGTTSPDAKLAVNGTIHTKEVRVDLNGWSDFVFEKDYELLTLEEVEQHINENGHLPEIPSEAEVTENGINLGEMNAKLLQKIEELTLHLIQEHKNTQELSKKIERLENELTTLKNEQKAKTSD